jgi:RimJ/RimL family protein N-acetyltransferase
VTRHIPPPPSSVAAWKAWAAATRRRPAGAGVAAFAVVKRATDDETAGLVQIATCPDEPAALMWGLVLAERFWGTGLFDAIARAAVDIATNQLRATALRAWVAADNEGAVSAFRRLPGGVLMRVGDAAVSGRSQGRFRDCDEARRLKTRSRAIPVATQPADRVDRHGEPV